MLGGGWLASAFDEAVGQDYGEDGDGAEADDDASEEALGDDVVPGGAVGNPEKPGLSIAGRCVGNSSE